MRRGIAVLAFAAVSVLCSCAKKETSDVQKPADQPAAAAQPAGAPHAFVNLKDGTKVPGTIVASSQTDMVVAGDDGIERKIPLTQIKSVDYGDAAPEPAQPSRGAVAPKRSLVERRTAAQSPAHPTAAAVTTKTHELPAGAEVSVRTNEMIDSSIAAEGQTFDAQVTRDATDASGDVVIPRGSQARVVIRSATKGGRIRGASDLVLDLQSVVIGGSNYSIATADITQTGKSGVGVNKRTAKYAGGGAALGAIIGAIAGGGKGAAIGAGAGAGAGAITQIITKGGAIKVPPESVLTFKLDQPLRVAAAQ